MKRTRAATVLALVAAIGASVALGACGTAPAQTASPAVLRMGVPPVEDVTLRQKVDAAAEAISKAAGVPVKVTETSDYLGIVEAMRSGLLDIALFSPMPTVIAQDVAKVVPLVAGVGGNFTAAVICRPGAGVTELADVANPTIAFVDPGSTSGNYVPRLLLKRAGVDVTKLKETFTGGNFEAATLAVKQGSTDCAASAPAILNAMTKKGVIQASDYKIIAESEPIPISGVYIARAGLSDELKGKITEGLVTEQPAAAKQAIGAGTLVKADQADWGLFRDAASQLGITLKDVG